jgi:hypothetical protein
MPQDRPIYPYRGPLSISGIEDLRDGKFRRERGAFRVDIGNEGWNFVVGGFGGDPNITTRDFVNGMNASGLNSKEISGLDRDNAALLGPQLAQTLNNLISRQIRLGFLVEQSPETSNSVTLSDPSITDGLGLRRPQISYRITDYTRKGIVQSRKMANLIFAKMGAKQFTKVLWTIPPASRAMSMAKKSCSTSWAPAISWGPTGWAATPRTRWSIRSSAPGITRICSWSAAVRFPRREPPIRR